MDFLQQLLRGIAFVPALVNGIEAMFGSKSGEQKKDAAMSFLQAALEVRMPSLTAKLWILGNSAMEFLKLWTGRFSASTHPPG